MDEQQLTKLKKSSRIGAIITAVGILIVLSGVIISIIQFAEKEKQTAVTINHIKDSVSMKLEDTINQVMKSRAYIPDPVNQIECMADPLDEKTRSGNPLYIFTLRISDSKLISRLKRVEYFFDYPDFDPRLKSSDNAEKNFAISYRGWGCLDRVSVYLYYKDEAKTDTVIFPMCEKTIIKLKSQGETATSLNEK